MQVQNEGKFKRKDERGLNNKSNFFHQIRKGHESLRGKPQNSSIFAKKKAGSEIRNNFSQDLLILLGEPISNQTGTNFEENIDLNQSSISSKQKVLLSPKSKLEKEKEEKEEELILHKSEKQSSLEMEYLKELEKMEKEEEKQGPQNLPSTSNQSKLYKVPRIQFIDEVN